MPYLFFSRRKTLVTAVLVTLSTVSASSPLAAQWLKYPTAGVPRKTDGKVDMSAPAPRMPDGKPDFSGIWTTGEPFDRRGHGLSSPKDLPAPRGPQSSPDLQTPGDPTAIVGSRQMGNIGIDLPGGLPISLGLRHSPKSAPTIWRRTIHTSGVCRTALFAPTGCRIC